MSRVLPPKELVAEAVKMGEKIASHSKLIVAMCKESVSQAYETTLQEGLLFEKRTFHTTFATVFNHYTVTYLSHFDCYLPYIRYAG